MTRKNARRVAVTFSPEAMALLDEFHTLTGRSRSALVAELFDEVTPVVQEMLTAIKAVKETPEKARSVVMDMIAGGHSSLTQLAMDFDREADGRTVRGKRARARPSK